MLLSKLRGWGRGAAAPHRKSTDNSATLTMPLPGRLVLFMRQGIGAACVPAVQKGDSVYVGSVVGKAGGFVGADVHSGVSGKVLGIETRFAFDGSPVQAVVIEPDGQQTVDAAVAPPVVRDRESFLAAVRASGLIGLGGAGFPTSVKLAPQHPEKIDWLLINAAECEPYITSDNREMLECGDSVISGIMACKQYLGIPRVGIGVERNKPEAMNLMFSLTKGDSELEVFPLPSHYPQGAEKILIQTITGREVPSDGLPADIGVLVLNVCTVSTIGKYLASGLPLTHKRITVDGGAIDEAHNVMVPVGTPVADVIAFCGGFKELPAKILVGGPMMGTALANVDAPVLKQHNAILALSKQEAFLPAPTPCIRCGGCVRSCPASLSPVEIAEAYAAGDVQEMAALHAEVCMGCGVCSYVCPAKRVLSPATTLARQRVLKEARK